MNEAARSVRSYPEDIWNPKAAMKHDRRHRIVATLVAVVATCAAATFLSAISGISLKMVAASGLSGAVYLALFALAFGWPSYIFVRALLAKKAGRSQ